MWFLKTMILRLGKWKNSQKKIKVTRNKFIGISKISKLEEAEGIEVGIQIQMYIRIPNRKLSLEREMKIEQEKYRLEMKEVEEVEAEAEETEVMVKEVLEIEDVEIEEEEAEEEVREVIMKEAEEDIENMQKELKSLNTEKKKYRMKVRVG